MQFIAVFGALFVVGPGFLCYGAYKLARRSDGWAVVLAPILVFTAWYVLLDLTNIGQGEGVAIGVVVIQFGLWYFGGLCVLLALILLGTSVYVRRSALAIGLLLFLIGPAVLALGYRVATDRGAKSTEPGPAKVLAEPHDTEFEGYVWAFDNNILKDSDCVGGNAAFIAGCKRAVARFGETKVAP